MKGNTACVILPVRDQSITMLWRWNNIEWQLRDIVIKYYCRDKIALPLIRKPWHVPNGTEMASSSIDYSTAC